MGAMMEYIVQYIHEMMILTNATRDTPQKVLIDLFFTRSTGKKWVNGIPHMVVEFNRLVPFTEYYKQEKSFDELVEFYKDYLLEDDIRPGIHLVGSYEQAWNQICVNLNSIVRINSLDELLIIDDGKDFYSFNDDIPLIFSTPTPSPLTELNENSELNLLLVGYSLARGMTLRLDAVTKLPDEELSQLWYKRFKTPINEVTYREMIDDLHNLFIEVKRLDGLLGLYVKKRNS